MKTFLFILLLPLSLLAQFFNQSAAIDPKYETIVLASPDTFVQGHELLIETDTETKRVIIRPDEYLMLSNVVARATITDQRSFMVRTESVTKAACGVQVVKSALAENEFLFIYGGCNELPVYVSPMTRMEFVIWHRLEFRIR